MFTSFSTYNRFARRVSLRVAELPEQVENKGFVRVDNSVLKKLELEVGGLVEIHGKKITITRAMPAASAVDLKGIIQMDEITRSNAQANLGKRVRLKKARLKTAEKITLKPLMAMYPAQIEECDKSVGALIEKLPLISGNRIRLDLPCCSPQEFSVLETVPQGPVIVQGNTLIRIEEGDASVGIKRPVSYQDIGGLREEVRRLREVVELPFRHPERFEQLGIQPPKGVLLFGPPGTGKTLIARAVANETGAYFLSINGPEIVHKFLGESEAKLRRLFEEAGNNAPSIIFLDEIDAIAPKRDSITIDAEKRLVSQLLVLMDGLGKREKVVVIGATNMPNALDPALRRPGRFDGEIEIGIPSRNGRLEILSIHTRNMPLADNIDLERLAEITHGFVGADLEALCREAAMKALRRISAMENPVIERSEGDELTPDGHANSTLYSPQVTMEDFLDALREIEPSATREVSTEIPRVKWEEIGGLEEIKRQLREAVELPLKYPDIFEYAHLQAPKGILLYGAPGTGKTLIAKAVATESEANFISIKGPELLSKFVGESERGVRELFKKAKQAAPCILFLDELDAMAPTRTFGGGDSNVTERVISQMLTEMDGIEELRDVIVLAATNRIDSIDPALLRPGRFDLHLQIPAPDEAARRTIFEIHTRERPVANDVDLTLLAQKTEGCVGADIELICRKATMSAIKEFLASYDGKDKSNYAKLQIRMKHFDEAITHSKATDNQPHICATRL